MNKKIEPVNQARLTSMSNPSLMLMDKVNELIDTANEHSREIIRLHTIITDHDHSHVNKLTENEVLTPEEIEVLRAWKEGRVTIRQEDRREKCPRCLGEKIIETTPYGEDKWHKVKCPTCNGSGVKGKKFEDDTDHEVKEADMDLADKLKPKPKSLESTTRNIVVNYGHVLVNKIFIMKDKKEDFDWSEEANEFQERLLKIIRTYNKEIAKEIKRNYVHEGNGSCTCKRCQHDFDYNLGVLDLVERI